MSRWWGCKRKLTEEELRLLDTRIGFQAYMQVRESENQQVIDLLREAQVLLTDQFKCEVRQAEDLMRKRTPVKNTTQSDSTQSDPRTPP